ncbi:HAMP domain-containing sensor histidine kinase [Roseibium sp. MMSF_3544]|uniref:sensor histidine kinase n=1 Tax=unclassified Roseibium TaxID=2629323 RepID=UPI00273F601B|nr:HAMP domain-containing sensor histidine kinase [Roseibium sp. MMSF_3544]
MTSSLRFGLFLIFCLFVLAGSRAETVFLEPGRGVPDMKASLTYYSDPSKSLGDILKFFRAGEFGDDLDTTMLEWNYAPEAWAGVEIFNDTIDDGRGADPFVLVIDLPLVSEVDAYLIRESGFTEGLINYSIFDPFVAEHHSVTRLRTPVFEIQPQESVVLLVNFKFGPFQSFDMALETPSELEASAFVSGITHTAFYAFCISSLVFFFGFHLAMKNWIGMLYALQFSVGLALIAYIDGLWFRFFYPANPALQSPVGFFLLFALSGIGFVISGRSVRDEGGETKLSVALTSMALLSVLGYIVSFFSPGPYLALFSYALLVLMFAATLLASRGWRRAQGEIHLTGTLIAVAGIVLGAMLLFLLVAGSRAEIIPVSTAVKGCFSVLLVATMTGLTAHIINLRRQHSKAVQAEFAALEAEAKRSQELLVAERNYSRARELASLRQRQLATASHDLKQPIMSLRMNVDSLAENMEPDVRSRLKEAFDYIEALSNDYLRQTTPEEPALESDKSPAAEGGGGAQAEPEVYEISLVLDTVYQMFTEEAVSKGLELRRVLSSKTVAVPPLIVMRIVSNLVSNAVKYTERGKVLFGVRARGAFLNLCVLDTGPGMDTTEISEFAEAYRKGDKSEGHGLGLSVCYELASENGMELTCTSEKQKGTAFVLTLPLA